MTTSATDNEVVAQKAARGTMASLILRILSFVCTQWTIRVLDPSTLGRASIQLELLLTSVLFVSREGFRLALTRQISENNWTVAWLSIPTATLVSLVALVWHLHHVSWAAESQDERDYKLAGILFCIACCIEGWAEPAALAALRRMDVTSKATAEGVATLAKTATTVVALQVNQDWPITAFGIAQIVYACVYAVVLYVRSWRDLKRPTSSSLDWHSVYLVFVFTLQGFFKHLLTEADRIVLTLFSGTYDQGVYAMGSAYGGMAARMILQPVEENARLLWSRLDGAKSPSKTKEGPKQTEPLYQSYVALVKVILYVGLVFSCFAINYTTILINLLAGKKWGSNNEAAAVLSAFCVYTGFMAWNGMTEAFVYAVASSGVDVGQLSLVHTVVGLVFAGAAYVTVPRYGTVGLVTGKYLSRALH